MRFGVICKLSFRGLQACVMNGAMLAVKLRAATSDFHVAHHYNVERRHSVAARAKVPFAREDVAPPGVDDGFDVLRRTHARDHRAKPTAGFAVTFGLFE